MALFDDGIEAWVEAGRIGIAQMRDRIAELTRERDEARAAERTARTDNVVLAAEWNNEREALRARVAELKAKIDEMDALLTDAYHGEAKAKVENAALRTRVAELEAALRGLIAIGTPGREEYLPGFAGETAFRAARAGYDSACATLASTSAQDGGPTLQQFREYVDRSTDDTITLQKDARSDALAEAEKIARKYDDCGGQFIADAIAELRAKG